MGYSGHMCCNPFSCSPESAPADDSLPHVDVQTAADRDEGTVLIDVREMSEWTAGHAPGAIHRRLGALDPAEFAGRGPVYVMCRSGNRSATATRRLRDADVDAYNVTGGIVAWAEAGLPAAFD